MDFQKFKQISISIKLKDSMSIVVSKLFKLIFLHYKVMHFLSIVKYTCKILETDIKNFEKFRSYKMKTFNNNYLLKYISIHISMCI
jgi:hypothetical protein